MKAEILCVGTELLLGDVVNTNAAFISRELAALGIDLYYHTVVGDNDARLKEQLAACFSRCDLVIMTGGLGPTYDDMTKETVAEYFGLPMETHQPSLEKITEFFRQLHSNTEMTPNNLKQAQIPKGATVLDNPNGTAPGMAVSGGGKTAILLPGPPREMEPMFKSGVIPYLQKLTGRVFVSCHVNIFGMGESEVESRLIDLMRDASNPTLATYVGESELYVRITASGATEEEARALIEPSKREVQSRLGSVIYGYDAHDLQHELVRVYTEKGLTAAAAESITGGLISKRITDVPGSSEMFGMGLVTYSNESKMQLLGVKAETLKAYGAVSEQTALEMAEGLRRISGADVCIAVTGIAGPGGGSEKKPVGLTYMGIADKDGVRCEKLEMGMARSRAWVRSRVAARAIYAALTAAGK